MADADQGEGSAARGILEDVRAAFGALLGSFRSPGLAKAVVAYIAFTISEWAAFIALVVYAYQDGGSVRVGLVGLLWMIPAAVVAPSPRCWGIATGANASCSSATGRSR
jgi:hypothetical protein